MRGENKMRILKYYIPLPGIDIYIPLLSKVLSFQMQNGQPVLWVLADDNVTEDQKYLVHFRYIGTGQEVSKEMLNGKYIGTIQDGMFVWHLFEVNPIVENK